MKHRLIRILGGLCIGGTLASGALVQDVRSALNRKDFPEAQRLLDEYRKVSGITSEGLAAQSWVGRAALANKDYAMANRVAQQTRRECQQLLRGRKLDDDKDLPMALGAAIEVIGQAGAAQGERSAAVSFLKKELRTYRNTSIRARIQKNIHLLSLEGKPMPRLDLVNTLAGPRTPPQAAWKNKVAVVFFWAHWCGDCKAQAAVLERLQKELAGEDILWVAPTQTYGYVTQNEAVDTASELRHIEQIRQKSYAGLANTHFPLSTANFRNFGCSTTPTLVVADREGIVRLYHPGKMSYEELAPVIQRWLRPQVSGRQEESGNQAIASAAR